MRVETPANLDDALRMLAAADGALTPIAGGTDLLVSWHHRPKADLHLMDMSRLQGELGAIRWTDEAVELGGLTTFWDAVTSPEIGREFPLLIEAARQVGAIQIQTRGTWAGNIANASPAADGVAVLMAYDATVVLRSASGETVTPLDRYYTGYKQTVRTPDQMITAIRMPRRKYTLQWFHKVGGRKAQAISKVGVAIVNSAAGWRVVANSVAPYVCRCRRLEKELDARPVVSGSLAAPHVASTSGSGPQSDDGPRPDSGLRMGGGPRFADPADIRRVLESDIAPIDDIRSTAAYRATVLSRLIFFWLCEQGM